VSMSTTAAQALSKSITASSSRDGEPRNRNDLDPRWETMARVGQLINYWRI
jgi:hypothetical protein